MAVLDLLIDWWRRRRWTAPKLRQVRVFTSRYDVPDRLPRWTMAHVAGEPGWAIFECPCGTGHDRVELLLNAHPQLPHWRLELNGDAATLYPSVDFVGERRCHFWLRDGRVSWVEDRRS